MVKIRFNLMVLMVYAFAPMAYAQTDSMTVELSEVVISENRIQLPYAEQTRSIVLQSATELRHVPISSVAEGLHYVAGVDVRTRGANGVQADVGIRGGTFDQSLILVDGVKISDMQTGHHSLNLPFDLSNVERVEVIKGPAARVYGQNAFAGAINIVTKTPKRTGLDIQITGGDFKLFGGRVGGTIKKETHDHYLSASYDKSAGYKYNTDYEMLNFFYQGGVKIGKGRLKLIAGVTDRSFGANGFYASPDFMDQYEAIITGLGALSFSTLIKDKAALESRVYYRTNHDEYIFIRDNPEFYRNVHVNNTLGFEVNTSIPSKLGLTGLGIDINQVNLTSNNLGDHTRFVATMFLEQRFNLFNDRLSITPGVQLNSYSDFGFIALPGVDMGYDLSDQFAVFASIGETYRVPTFTDLYYTDPVNSGNPDLQPEYAWTYEVGLKSTRLPGFIIQSSVFYRDGRDIIDWIRPTDTEPWTPVNVREVSMLGFDNNFSLLLDQLTGKPNVFAQRIDLNYTFINSESTGEDTQLSRYALENLKHQFMVGLHLQYFGRIKHSVMFSYNDRVNLDDYSLLDTRIAWEQEKYSIFVDVTNIFDVTYQETNLVTMPGRWAKMGVRISL